MLIEKISESIEAYLRHRRKRRKTHGINIWIAAALRLQRCQNLAAPRAAAAAAPTPRFNAALRCRRRAALLRSING